MRVVLHGRRTWLLWSLTFWLLTFVFVLGISMSALTVTLAGQLPSGWQAPWTAPPATDIVQVVKGYRQGEQAALLTLADSVLAQLPVFATEAALDQVTERVAALRNAGEYQQLDIPALEVVQIRRAAPYIEVLTHEEHTLTTYPQVPAGTPGAGAGTTKTETLAVVYRLAQAAGRWKVARVEYSAEYSVEKLP
jgi:hypothetical protein